MMEIKTITGQSLDEFLRPKVPQGLISPLINKLKVLKIYGRECVGAFVFEHEHLFYFEVTDPSSTSEGVIVYISFFDYANLIIIVEVVIL